MSKYRIDYEDLGIMHQDSGPWRSYELNAEGDSLEELIEDATISETDQDGGELNAYGLDECSAHISDIVMGMLEDIIAKKDEFDSRVTEEQKMKGNDL